MSLAQIWRINCQIYVVPRVSIHSDRLENILLQMAQRVEGFLASSELHAPEDSKDRR